MVWRWDAAAPGAIYRVPTAGGGVQRGRWAAQSLGWRESIWWLEAMLPLHYVDLLRIHQVRLFTVRRMSRSH